MVSALSIGIIILEDYVVDPLVGTTRIGRHNGLTKHVNKISLGRTMVSIGYRRGFRYCRYMDADKKGIIL